MIYIKKTQFRFITIRNFYKPYKKMTNRCLRLTIQMWNDFIIYLESVQSHGPDNINDEKFLNIPYKVIFKEEKASIIAKTNIYKKNRGVTIGEYLDNKPSYPNIIWLPISKIAEFIDKDRVSQTHKTHSIEKTNPIQTINVFQDKTHSNEIHFNPFYDIDFEKSIIFKKKTRISEHNVNDISDLKKSEKLEFLEFKSEIKTNKLQSDEVEIPEDQVKRVFEVERKIRNFIEKKLKDAYGDNWWKKGIPGGVDKEVYAVYADDISKIPGKKPDSIETGKHRDLSYCDIRHLKEIIIYGNNWGNIFGNCFGGATKERKIIVSEEFNRFNKIRQKTAHSKLIVHIFILLSGMTSMYFLEGYTMS
jgi:hypothetical protein